MSAFWKVDEDGERVHRLQSEWDGNKGAWKEWGGYRSEADWSSLGIGANWSSWGVGVEYDWHHGRTWDGASVDYRHRFACLTLGPWYVVWHRVRPFRRPDSGAALLPGLLLGLILTALLALAFLAGESRRCEHLREQGSALVERYCGTESGG